MPKFLTLRALVDEEEQTLRRLAHSRIDPARAVERARIVWRADQGARVPAIAREVGVGEQTVRLWPTRCDAHGLAGRNDGARAGRPPTYPPEQVGDVVAASLTDPQALALPFASWTLDRLEAYLEAYLNEEKGIPITRSRIGELLQAEGRRWRSQEPWFGERVDPAFAEQRGRSSPSTRRHLRIVP